ncbi:Prostate-associated microseminoprotein [Galemys pyrenaicus]|uniref:Beta-microseminoprotein n=1 Tax=Galemys pyrenaicus TaxID=202257 RepID=A0A8J5ZSX1_GALPY|nr:Prostate-associated microseminoprotein [Galemys pyrenaicus]
MALGMPWASQVKATPGGWGTVCLVISLLLQYPGVHSKCYFQAQGKGGQWELGGRGLKEDVVLEYPGFFQHGNNGVVCQTGSVCPQTPPHTNISCSSLAPCHYEGKYYSLGESWLRKDCFHCTCLHPVGVGCCDTSQHPIDFPAECEVRQEAGTCQFSLVQKSDPRLPCKGGGPNLEWGSANTPVPGVPAPHSS